MGLTREREGRRKRAQDAPRVLLAGNPNVGKSTVFNALTGLSRHTGNWTGKTVDCAEGVMRGSSLVLCDLPGCYSLDAGSPEEEIAREAIESPDHSAVVIVCDASAPARSLNFALQTLSVTRNAIVCLNLIDEAAKRGIRVDGSALAGELGVPVVLTDASKGKGLDELKKAIIGTVENEKAEDRDFSPQTGPHWAEAERIAELAFTFDADTVSAKRLKLDRLLTGRFTGKAIMLLLLALSLFITLVGAQAPSSLLSRLSDRLLGSITRGLLCAGVSETLVSALCDGMLGTLFTVVSVMLPPMAIFFPLFTLLEDLGLLPRIAFGMDRGFARCGACGRSALTLCMGLGCNAAGVVGCRIIESPRERMIAILTNSLIPCNGRFPALAALITAFFTVGAGAFAGAVRAVIMAGAILLSIGAALGASKLLSVTLLRGESSSFVLELPPFRRPNVRRVIVRSMLDRTLFVLGRAVLAALPAGLIIWALRYTGVMGVIAGRLDPIGRALGLDGGVLVAYALGLPANELIMPLLLSIYGGGGGMASILAANGWGIKNAVCMLLMMLFHSPCATTLLTIKKETRSIKWCFIAFLIPVVTGVSLCALINLAFGAFGL